MTDKIIIAKGTPLPLQYLGSKFRIAKWIINLVEDHFKKPIALLDLFAGTGSVSIEAMNHGFIPYLNDIQPYSATILKSIFCENRAGLTELIETLNETNFQKRLLMRGRNSFNSALKMEEKFFNDFESNCFVWKDYKVFCANSKNPLTKSQINGLRKKNEWNLFVSYFANRYFGVRQSLEIDSLREYADELPEHLRTHLLAALISALSNSVSSTTHLAQYLKPTTRHNTNELLKKRKQSILKFVLAGLVELQKFPTSKKSFVTNFNYIDAIDNFGKKIKKNGIIYADPPYFKEHYSRYYHVLDTLLLYDYPYISINPVTKSVSAGLYRENRIVSDFGLKSKAFMAFELLFATAAKNNLPVVLSYANTSLVKKANLIMLAEKYNYKVNLQSKKLDHTGQGQRRHKTVTEYLFICTN